MRLFDTNRYLTRGTVGSDGRPWASPVYFAHRDASHSSDVAYGPEPFLSARTEPGFEVSVRPSLPQPAGGAASWRRGSFQSVDRSWDRQALVIREDDVDTMLNHSLIQADLRFDIRPS